MCRKQITSYIYANQYCGMFHVVCSSFKRVPARVIDGHTKGVDRIRKHFNTECVVWKTLIK